MLELWASPPFYPWGSCIQNKKRYYRVWHIIRVHLYLFFSADLSRAREAPAGCSTTMTCDGHRIRGDNRSSTDLLDQDTNVDCHAMTRRPRALGTLRHNDLCCSKETSIGQDLDIKFRSRAYKCFHCSLLRKRDIGSEL